MENKMTSIKLNDKQVAFLKALTNTAATLAEISTLVGFEVKSGTVNALVKKGLVTHAEDRVITCPECGHKHTVKTYVSTEATAAALENLNK